MNYCDASCERGWADESFDDGYALTAPVGSYPHGASWVGALDLAGNAWEWGGDWYGEYPSGQQENPIGPSVGEYRVVRGGGWAYRWVGARAANRRYRHPDAREFSFGLRCVLAGE
jgi:formylglycine-generating enzyme required for sulfatase activity